MRMNIFHISLLIFLVLSPSLVFSTAPSKDGSRATLTNGVALSPSEYGVLNSDQIALPPPVSNSTFWGRATTFPPPQGTTALSESAAVPPPRPPTGAAVPRDITWWCSKTPHQETCNYYFKRGLLQHRQAPKYLSHFRRMLVELALHQALTTRDRTVKFGPNCRNERRRAAWSDCVKLYEDTVLQLTRTLRGLHPVRPGETKCTAFDAQTWLSTAQTNIDTCRFGSQDLNVSEIVAPAVCNRNLSDLIGNCLAVNGVFMKQQNHTTANYEEYFPSWISTHERRLLLSSSYAKSRANLVVAKDGSGRFRSIQAAINLAARRRNMARRFVIYIKRGVYRENIEVGNNNNNLMIVGDGIRLTLVTSDRSVGSGFTTYNSATAGFGGFRFMAKAITFTNTAGPWRGQAVAVRSSSDLSVFYRVAIHGFQDSLYIHSQRQFYRECYISGTVDFIFGNAAAVIQNCIIMLRRPLRGQANVITAQGRGDPFQNTGIAIQSCRIMAAPDLRPVVRAVYTYLGRPWQAYSRVVILKTFMDDSISPLGWSPWISGSKFALDTVFYGEYRNFGPGSSTRWRVRWKGFHVITSPAVASRFTVRSLIAGGSWLPATGVPFKTGL